VGSPTFKSIRELSEEIKEGKASPVELAEYFLDRLENFGPKYNSVVTVTRDRALEEAEKAEREVEAGEYRGALHGVPYGVKDLLATSGGIPTSWGAYPFRKQVFDFDGTVVRKLMESGAVLTGKLAMIELAGGGGYRQPHASFTGAPKNPWNPGYWTGGSSSGSGASVAGGFVPFAIGSETWGSILSPANNCGVSGLRPTYGRVSRYGAMALCWTLDKLGPLCLTADDCGLVLEAISGPDPKDETTTDMPFKYVSEAPEGGFRLAVIKGAMEGADEEVVANFEESLKVLEGVTTVEEIEFPDLPYEAITRTILNAESASAFEEFIEGGGDVGAHRPRVPLRALRPDHRPRQGLPESPAPEGPGGEEGRRGDGALRCGGGPCEKEPRHAHRPGVQEDLLRDLARHHGGRGQLRRPPLDRRAQRVHGDRSTHWHPVHGEGVRGEHHHRDSQGLPVKD